MIHELKCWPKWYASIADGSKPFEFRHNDRRYAVGDTLVLREFEPVMEAYTGNECRREVTFVLTDFIGMNPDYCVMGLRIPQNTKEGWVESKSLAGISFPTMMPSETNKLPTPDEGNGETVGRAIAETTRNASNTEAQRSTILPCGCDTERSPRWMRIGCGCLPKSENG